jgi:hypothetical protein
MYFTTIESVRAELDYRTENALRGRNRGRTAGRRKPGESRVPRPRGGGSSLS